MAKGGGTTRSVNSSNASSSRGTSASSEKMVKDAVKKARWEDMGGGVYQLDTGERGVGGGMILEDTSEYNRLEYGQRTVYEVQDVWDEAYNVFVNRRTGFSSLAQAQKFVVDQLIENHKKKH